MILRIASSSSASRMVSSPVSDDDTCDRLTLLTGWAELDGSMTFTEVPSPGALSMDTSPPHCSTMERTVASPRPVPEPGPLVVKKGSKAWASCSCSIPSPVSLTRIMA